jgi:poly-gamma-glutamate synthesis protein (capsule biosynthesis protein)
VSAGFIPCWIEPSGAPRPLGRSEGEKIKSYVEAITAKAGLKASFVWDGERVVFQ